MDTGEGKISELEEMSVETSKTEMQREREWKRQNRISKNLGET